MNTQEVEEFIKIRKDFHRHPEVSNHEVKTSKKILQHLNEFGVTNVVTNIGGHGLIAVFESGIEGPHILIRADMDALPIQEISDCDHKSIIPNVAHMCGHDGHTTILLSLAKRLVNTTLNKGKVVLLFQPSEEIGMGARAMLDSGCIHLEKIDYAFAMHNIPGNSINDVIVKSGSFTAHVNTMIIQLKGKTAHAAEPENGYNPAMAVAEILAYCNGFMNKDVNDEEFYLITPVYMNMGSHDYGISADRADIRFTIRAWNTNVFNRKSKEFISKINAISEKYHLSKDIEWTHEFFANQNDESAVDIIKSAANDLGHSIVERSLPFKWGEDFGLFTQRFNGAMFGMGNGINSPALHNPDYDFNDKLIKNGSQMFYTIIQKILID